jgi:hypothetical protein
MGMGAMAPVRGACVSAMATVCIRNGGGFLVVLMHQGDRFAWPL